MIQPELLIATNNPGKIREYSKLLSGCGFKLVTLAEKGINIVVAETGKTFAENAALKAEALAAVSGLLTLADDSGLEVDALEGAPGVLSARYAGEKTSDSERNEFLLQKLEGVTDEQRTARFRCVIAIVGIGSSVKLAEGAVEGFITRQPRGSGGFGYDPVFYLPELQLTMAEIAPDEKNRLSHRASAAMAACSILAKIRSGG